jgi:hypothetical protein
VESEHREPAATEMSGKEFETMSARRRHEGSHRPNGSERKRDLEKQEKTAAGAPASPGDLFSFTIDVTTAQVVKVETLDASGARHEVSDREKANLAPNGSERLEEALEEAFQAGIDCILGGAEDPDDAEESAQDAELRHVLVTPLIKQSPAKRLLRRDVLDRAILKTLIQRSMKPGRATRGPRANRSGTGSRGANSGESAT